MSFFFDRVRTRVATGLSIALLLSACGSTATPTTGSAGSTESSAPASTTAAAPVSAETNALIEASRNEPDGLLVYSIMSESNWAPVLAGFTAKYPHIKVTTTDLGAYEVFERYYTEVAGNARTADFISTTAPDGWVNMLSRGEIEPYVSSEDANVAEVGKIDAGLYAVSTDPMAFVYNKALLPSPPKTMAELVSLIEANPADWQGKLITYDAAGEGFGYGLNWFYTQAKGDEGWQTLEAIGSTKPKLQTSGGKIIDSVLSGETSLGFFVSNITIQPRLAAAGELLGYAFVPDAQVIAVRGMAVTKNAKSPASAKLLVDYILSREGQIAFAKGGLTAYRPDVASEAPLHLSQVSAAVGGDANLIFSRPNTDIADETKHNEFIDRWEQALQISR